MDARRKKIGRIIKKLGSALQNGDSQRFSDELEASASKDVLTAIREQKLLVKRHPACQETVADAVSRSACTVLSEDQAREYVAYLKFVDVWKISHISSSRRLKKIFHTFPKLPERELLVLLDTALLDFLTLIPLQIPTEQHSVSDFEREIHQRNGVANDVVFAGLRALNEAAKIISEPKARQPSPSNRYSLMRRFKKALYVASELNSLEWILDWVTYGDLIVSSVQTNETSEVKFEYADARRSLLRELSIRRKIVLQRAPAITQRYLRKMLSMSESAVLQKAVAYYSDQVGLNSETTGMTSLLERSGFVLRSLNAEDDMLVAATASVGQQQCTTDYLSFACLHWFEMASGEVRKSLPTGSRRFLAAPSIPTHLIELDLREAGCQNVSKSIERFTSSIPSRSHFDLVRKPFIRLSDGDIRCTTLTNNGLWNTIVREVSISGGSVGAAYGKMWEEFFADSFQKSGWEVIGRNQMLRSKGKLVTEVDLLIKKNDLLLAIEVKALIGSSTNCYDHWRNRQTVEWGCRQAAKAAEFIRNNEAWLSSVADRKTAEEIRHVEPLVFTNMSIFDGWKFEGVPVIGEPGRKSITEGSKVEYRDTNGSVELCANLGDG